MAANFENMWFYLLAEAVPASGRLKLLPLYQALQAECDFRHIQASRPGFGGLTRRDAAANQPNLSLAPNYLDQVGFSF